MKSLKYLAYSLIIFLYLQAYSFALDVGEMRISLINGDVEIYSPDSNEWSAASINMPIITGNKISINGEGKVELEVKGGTYIRFMNDSLFDVISFDKDEAHFYLENGHVYLNNIGGNLKTIQIDTPQVSINSYEKTIFKVDLNNNNSDVSVLKGKVYVKNIYEKIELNMGNQLTIGKEDSGELSPLSQSDEWNKWNNERNKLVMSWGESYKYLPDDLQEYSYTLNEHGTWIWVKDYGYVWEPIIVIHNWAPYRIGYWSWIEEDYVWVSFETWGWVPYHYGRWAFINSRWCWIPPRRHAIFWAPGYVAWIHTPQYIGWVPLAPHEIYYGHGYYGPHSVNINKKHINVTEIHKNYINNNVKNSITVMKKNNFIKGYNKRENISNEIISYKNAQFSPIHTFHRGRIINTENRHIKAQKNINKYENQKNVEQVQERSIHTQRKANHSFNNFSDNSKVRRYQGPRKKNRYNK